jgi:hypothetical protein
MAIGRPPGFDVLYADFPADVFRMKKFDVLALGCSL